MSWSTYRAWGRWGSLGLGVGRRGGWFDELGKRGEEGARC